MNVYRMVLRSLASQRVAQIDPRHLASLMVAAQDPDEVLPIGDDAQADEPEMDSGVLVYRIRGTIVHHWTDGFDRFGMVSPTEWLVDTLKRAAIDDAVRGVILDVDSGGGMAVGTPEAADAVFRFRQVKPIWSVANGGAYSAAGYIGAAAERFLVTPSGGVGSYGTLMIHEDVTEMLEKLGVKIEILRATESENKARFNPFEPLTDEEREVVQAELDTFNARFLSDMEKFRGMEAGTVAEVSELGRTFLAADAVERGLADEVMTLDDAIGEMAGMVARPAPLPPGEESEEGSEDEPRAAPDAAVETRNLSETEGAEIRVAPLQGGGEKLDGVALKYGSMSVDLGGWWEEFEAGAFVNLDDGDLRVLWQHDKTMVFGKVKAGTARIWEEGGALRYTANPPDATWARDALESIRRGDVDQNSFRFAVLPGGERWERRAGKDVRVVTKAKLVECGPQSEPAYTDTTVAVRSLAAWRSSTEYADALANEKRQRAAEREIYERRAKLREMTL